VLLRLCPLPDINDDGFGQAVLGAHAVAVPEELEEAEACFKDGGAVAEGAFGGLPEPHSFAGKRERPDTRDPLSWSLAVAEVVGQAEIEQDDGEVAGFVEIPLEIDVILMKDVIAPRGFERRPDDDRQEDVDGIAEKPLPEGRERYPFEGLHPGCSVRVIVASGLWMTVVHGIHYTECLGD
jgi:hypothetical protein